MATPANPTPPETPSADQAAPTPGQPVRSEGLLPADDAEEPLEVAEEVSLNQYSAATP